MSRSVLADGWGGCVSEMDVTLQPHVSPHLTKMHNRDWKTIAMVSITIPPRLFK